MTGYLALSWLIVVTLLLVPDMIAAGQRKGLRVAAELVEVDAHWRQVRDTETELDVLVMQRMTLLDDCRAAYCDRYLDEPVYGDWSEFVAEEKARLDEEIERLGAIA